MMTLLAAGHGRSGCLAVNVGRCDIRRPGGMGRFLAPGWSSWLFAAAFIWRGHGVAAMTLRARPAVDMAVTLH